MKHLLVIAMLALAVNVRGETNELVLGTSPPPYAVIGDVTILEGA